VGGPQTGEGGRPRAGATGGRLARTHYTVRTASFAYCFLVIGLVLWERGAGVLAWGLLGLQFLLYPQLAYLRALAAQDSRDAEIGNLHFDALTLGAWVAMLGFPTWIAYAALFSTTLNLSIVRGAHGAAGATVCFAAGALAWIAPMGFTHYHGTSDLVSALCFFGSLAYSAGVGLVVRRQHLRLRSAREALRESERRYRRIADPRGREDMLDVAGLAFDQMGDAMMVTNAAGRILTINRAFTRITGYEAAEVLGQHESRFRSGMQSAAFYDDLYAAVLRSGQWRGSTWSQRRDGTAYREWRSVSAVRDAEDRVTHYVSLFGELDGAAERAGEALPPERPARTG